MIITEALNKALIKKNFSSFFKEIGKDITMNVISTLRNITRNVVKHIAISFDQEKQSFNFNEYFEYFENDSIFLEEFPTIYMEKIMSELKAAHKNEEIKKIPKYEKYTIVEFIIELAYLSRRLLFEMYNHNIIKVLISYAALFLVRVVLKKNGMQLTKEFMEIEKEVFNKNYDVVLNKTIEFFRIVTIKKLEREKSRMRNRKVYEDSEIEVYKVDDSREACILLGKGTDWCVANTRSDYSYREYSSYGDMYVFIFKNIKNSYDGQGPEKALLTVKNKVSPENKFENLNVVVEAIQNKRYRYGSVVGILDNKIVAPDLLEFIQDTESIKLINNFGQSEVIQELINYIINIYSETLNNKLLPFPLVSLETIIVNQDRFEDDFYKPLYSSFERLYREFLNKYFNISEVKQRVSSELLDKIKKIKELIDKYEWLKNINDLSIDISYIFESKDGQQHEILLSKLENLLNSGVVKYPLIIADSSNRNFGLFSGWNNSENHRKLAELMLNWPGLKKYLNIDNIDFWPNLKNFFNSIDKLQNPDYVKALNFINSRGLILHIQNIVNDFRNIIINAPETLSFIKDKEYFFNVLKHYDDLFEVVYFLFSIVYLHDISYSRTPLNRDINVYFTFSLLTAKDKISHNEYGRLIYELDKAERNFIRNSIEYWEENGVFNINMEDQEKFDSFIKKLEERVIENEKSLNEVIQITKLLREFLLQLINYLNKRKRT